MNKEGILNQTMPPNVKVLKVLDFERRNCRLLIKDNYGEAIIREASLNTIINLFKAEKRWHFEKIFRYTKNSHEYFLSALKDVNPWILERYKIISICKKLTDDIFMEDKFGLIKIKARTLLKTKKIGIQAYLDQEKYFKLKCAEIHNSYYDYKDVCYKSGTEKVNIHCPIHGLFNQMASNHLNGKGCPICAKILNTRYNIKLAERHKEKWINTPAIIYKIKLRKGQEEFYKVGITTRTIKERFGGRLPYQIVEKKEMNIDLYEAVYIEKSLLKEYSSYKPKIKFGGYTECFI